MVVSQQNIYKKPKMKKLSTLLAITLCLSIGSLSAQNLKPEGGEKSVEVNFDPSFNSPTISINELRLRYFMSESLAIRLGLFVNSNSYNDPQTITDPTGSFITLSSEFNTFSYSFAPGIEKHFEGTDRLSPYIGAEIRFGQATFEYKNDRIDDFMRDPYEQKVTGGSTTIGLNLLVGADFYFSKHIYLGTELGYGVINTDLKDERITNYDGRDTKTVNIKRGDYQEIGVAFNSAIRLGFLF
jgi:outer membrane protein W